VDANEDEEIRMLRKWARAPSRRGRKPKEEAEPALEQGDILAAAAEPNPNDSKIEASPKKADALPVNVPEALAAAMTQAPAPTESPRATAAPRVPVSHRRPRLAVAAGLAVVVLGAFLFARAMSPARVLAPPNTSAEAVTTQQAGPGHEVAQSAKPLDPQAGEGAEPAMDSISAPVMITMLSKDDTSEKPQEKTKVFGPTAKVIGTGLVCTTLSGCLSPQVRPTPQPEPCPARAVETMKKLGIDIEEFEPHTASFDLTSKFPSAIPVREGKTTLLLFGDWGKLPDGTLLSGRLIFGDGRVYGRLTEAKVPGGGTFKVCLEVGDVEGGRGAIREPDGGPESARIFSTVNVRAVNSFK
ncbi:MAG: hypothetical protein ACXU86_14675, partial [Archangium sp.]